MDATDNEREGWLNLIYRAAYDEAAASLERDRRAHILAGRNRPPEAGRLARDLGVRAGDAGALEAILQGIEDAKQGRPPRRLPRW